MKNINVTNVEKLKIHNDRFAIRQYGNDNSIVEAQRHHEWATSGTCYSLEELEHYHRYSKNENRGLKEQYNIVAKNDPANKTIL